MKCDTCEFKKLHIGFGPPDDYSAEYCSNGHWVGGPLDEVIEDDYWANCADYRVAVPKCSIELQMFKIYTKCQ